MMLFSISLIFLNVVNTKRNIVRNKNKYRNKKFSHKTARIRKRHKRQHQNNDKYENRDSEVYSAHISVL